tara:strand:+ start:1021 stop:1614 length:594 start_codon:yes stop_codon:yes gene_type:complete
MVSILKTDKIQASHGSTIEIPTGHSVNAVDTAGIYAPGQIIQIVRTTPATTSSVTLSSSPPNMIEFSSDNRTTITPKFATSLLRLNFSSMISGQNSSAICSMKFYDQTNNANVGFSALGTGSSRTFCNASFRTKDHDANDRVHLNMTAYEAASNTTARTYSIYGMIESGTMYMNMTTTDNAGCSYCPPVFTIEEIAQ